MSAIADVNRASRFAFEQKERELAQDLCPVGVAVKRAHRTCCQSRGLLLGAVDTEYGHKRCFSLPLILSHRLAGLLARTYDIEKIVGDLIKKAEIARVIA